MEIIDTLNKHTRSGDLKRIIICMDQDGNRRRFSVLWGQAHKVSFRCLESCYAFCMGRGWDVSMDRYHNQLARIQRTGGDDFSFEDLDLSIKE